MLDKSKILSFVRDKGPVLPRDVVKAFGSDTFFTGAFLSQMVDSKEIKITHGKIGGSPLYYVQNQEDKLQILYKYLPGKEKEAYDLLKEKKIIRDSDTEPAIRVALRSIKDFAKPLEVSISDNKEIFWKWYLFSNELAEQHIKNQLYPKSLQEEKKIVTAEPIKPEQPKMQELVKKEEIKKPDQKKEEVQEKIKEQREEKTIIDSELLSKARKLFIDKDIEILETKVIRKNSEIEMVIKVPSPVGKLRYYCKIRDKKKSNDRDLSSVYLEGQMKKLPALYVTTGDLTKKAEDMLTNELISVLYLK